mmetsp:Transcript_19027/g.62579  ORF Transcript_19027/g.62579 Transcript_19027/m.62579 type:complete len:148 (+) Transcript_19027:1491-1934(+)
MIGLSDSSLNDLNITNFQAVGVMASTYLEPPFLTEWEGLTVQIVEISPPIFDGSDSKRGRYQRTSDVLDQNDFRTIYRCLDTETNTFLAWNEVERSQHLSSRSDKFQLGRFPWRIFLASSRCACWKKFAPANASRKSRNLVPSDVTS